MSDNDATEKTTQPSGAAEQPQPVDVPVNYGNLGSRLMQPQPVNRGRFVKGQPRPPGAGRKPGSKNKVPKTVREAVIAALNSGKGAVAFFQDLRDGPPEDRRTFAQICSRLIPQEATLAVEGSVSVQADAVSNVEAARRLAFIMEEARQQLLREGKLPEPQPVALLPAPPRYVEVDRRSETYRPATGPVEKPPIEGSAQRVVVNGRLERLGIDYAEQGLKPRHRPQVIRKRPG